MQYYGSSSAARARSQEVTKLEELKSLAEGGTKTKYDDFLTTLINHIALTWENGSDVVYMMENHKDPVFGMPKDLGATPTEVEKMMKTIEVQNYMAKIGAYEDNKKGLYTLIMDNISKIVTQIVKATKGYHEADDKKDAIWILQTLEDIITNFKEDRKKEIALDEQMAKIMSLKQKEEETNEDFVKSFWREVKIYVRHGGFFMWAKHHKKRLDEEVEKEKQSFFSTTKTTLTDEDKKKLKEFEKTVMNTIQEDHCNCDFPACQQETFWKYADQDGQ